MNMDIKSLFYEWNPSFFKHEKNSNYSNFTNKVMKVAYTIIHGTSIARMPQEGKEWFQFTPYT